MTKLINLGHMVTTDTGPGPTYQVQRLNGKQPFNRDVGVGTTTERFVAFISNREADEYMWGGAHMSDASTLVIDSIQGGTNGGSPVNFSAGVKDVTSSIPGFYAYYAGCELPVTLGDGGIGARLGDPNADRMLFWDDSSGQVTWLAPSAGLLISGTNIGLDVPGLGESAPRADDLVLTYSGAVGAHKAVRSYRLGGIQLLYSGVLSNTTNILAFVDALTGQYGRAILEVRNARVSADNAQILARLSNDSGATYPASGLAWSSSNGHGNVTDADGSSSDSSIAITKGASPNGVGNAAGKYFNARIELSWTDVKYDARFTSASGAMSWVTGAGRFSGGSTYNGFNMFPSSGVFTTGNWAIYGVPG